MKFKENNIVRSRKLLFKVLIYRKTVSPLRELSDLIHSMVPAKIEYVDGERSFLQKLRQGNFGLVLIEEGLSLNLGLLGWVKKYDPLTSLVVISGNASVPHVAEVMRAGADDYLLNPIDLENFRKTFRRCLSQKRVIRAQKRWRGDPLIYIDDVTGLYNSRYLNHILDQEIALSLAEKKSFSMMFIDIDRFKSINDRYGHRLGTQLLYELGIHFKNCIRERGRVFRYGGDEFVVVFSGQGFEEVRAFSVKLTQSVSKKIFLKREGLFIKCGVSIGISVFPEHAVDKTSMLEAADHAMYVSKRRVKVNVPELRYG